MMLAFLWWLTGGKSELCCPVSQNEHMILSLPTVGFTSLVCVLHDGEAPPDEDDPDIEMDDWDAEWEDERPDDGD